MTQHPPQPAGDAPKAKIRKRNWSFPFVWVVPAAAAIVAGYLVYQRVHEFGPVINVKFRDVSGLRPGQTPVQFRGADIGIVASVALTDDGQFGIVRIKLRRDAQAVARAGSQFWVVRPELGMGSFTGLGTIITGPAIAVLPGHGKPSSEFTGLESSPETIDPTGLNIVLLAAHGGSLNQGVPIYYRGIQVGAVQETRLSTNAQVVEVHCVIRRAYAPLVRTDSKFWNVTGLDVRVGLFRGAEVDVESLKSLLIGGIAFATPESHESETARDGTAFRLYPTAEKEWTEWKPQIAITPEADATQFHRAGFGAERDVRWPNTRPQE